MSEETSQKPCLMKLAASDKLVTCEYIRKNHMKMINNFRKDNHTNVLKRDRFYESYCKSLYDFMVRCECTPRNMDLCFKCGDTYTTEIIGENEKPYKFCELCAKVLNTFPDPSEIVELYLRTDLEKDSQNANIFNARINRMSGQATFTISKSET